MGSGSAPSDRFAQPPDTGSPAPTVPVHGADTGKIPQQPERVGGYRVVREIGRGGMGVVYEAEQLALGRRVALKVLPLPLWTAVDLEGGSGDSTHKQRFLREARAAAGLHHPNIVPVYEVGEDGSACYYAMQFIHGQSLSQVLDDVVRLGVSGCNLGSPRPTPGSHEFSQVATRPVESDDHKHPTAAPASGKLGETSIIDTGRRRYYRTVARIGIQVAEALDYAHRQGVIHRDIKPANLLLDGDHHVWVADFGLAKTAGDPLTQSGDILGTVRYMAPERFRGWADPRSDVYSLGLTLYEMLLLRPAFAARDRLHLIDQVTRSEPPRLRSLDRRIPRDLETIVNKAIDREPARRYQTAGELAADLQRYLDDKPILARRAGAGERFWRWCRRNPMVAALIVL
jgi:serine/threonine protein kinase